MKIYLIILILVLCFTCWLNDGGTPPSKQPIGSVNKITDSAYGVNHQDNIVPDFTFTDQQRSSGYITKIDEKSQSNEAEFPMGIR